MQPPFDKDDALTHEIGLHLAGAVVSVAVLAIVAIGLIGCLEWVMHHVSMTVH